MKITFRREPHDTGLAAMSQGARGWTIHINGEEVGAISPVTAKGSRYEIIAWSWCVTSTVEYNLSYFNSYTTSRYTTPEEAKAAAKAYILEKQKEG